MTLATYYSRVYASSVSKSAAEARELLLDLLLHTLSEEDNLALEAEITTEEIKQAIHGLNSGKALGPNGIPIELYKAQSEIIAPFLLQMFLSSIGRNPPRRTTHSIASQKTTALAIGPSLC